VHVDFWPDITEYQKTYPTALTNQNGTAAHVFSSWDQSTTDLHFQWMRRYGIDGVFVQRFFSVIKTENDRHKSRVILEHSVQAAEKYSRAFAVMYDLSGLKASGEDCSAIIQDWKELVDDLQITSQKPNNYLYHHGKPLVAIWGVGFPDRPYNIHKIGLEALIDFLKNDPKYGHCAVLLGVPTHFRDLNEDCLPDPYIQRIVAQADIILPWMVGRYSPLRRDFTERYVPNMKADIAWCEQRHLDYAPCLYPGFSWHNLSRTESLRTSPVNQIPRQKGAFYWNEVNGAIQAGAKMFYVAMFDEMDEGTAIFKCTNVPPPGAQFCDFEGLPSDHYLWLTGEAGKMLRGEIPLSNRIPTRSVAKGD
jgi:hypothetical protein